MRIFLIIIFSITAIGSTTPARAFCPLDIACEPYHWEPIDNLEECENRKRYCLDINRCWSGKGFKTDARHYRTRVIYPSYEACIQRNWPQQ